MDSGGGASPSVNGGSRESSAALGEEGHTGAAAGGRAGKGNTRLCLALGALGAACGREPTGTIESEATIAITIIAVHRNLNRMGAIDSMGEAAKSDR